MYYTAKSYEKYTLIGDPYTKNGKLYSKAECKCDRCGGMGIIVARVENGIPIPIPVDNGVCYRCNGSGIEQREIRLYTEKERAILDRAAEARSIKREAELEARKAEAAAQSETRKREWMQRNGFNEDGLTWCVFGDDTYAIKDELKKLGCKYSPLLKWHSPIPLDIPCGYGMFSVSFDDIFHWDTQTNNALCLETAKQFIDRKFTEAEGPSISEYVGQPGERIRHTTAILKSRRGFNGMYGWTNIYTFAINNNILVWFTVAALDIESGSTVDLSGTIVAHEEYKGTKTTRLNRCKVVKIA